MATAVALPKSGNTVEDCIITNWKKQVGDTVAEGEILCEVETDKAIMEVESTTSGTLLAIFFKPGDVVPVLTTIAVIGEAGEAVDDFAPTVAESAPAAPEPIAPQNIPTPMPTPSATPTNGGQVFVSPRARHLAQSKNLSIDHLQGTGPGGRIIERDIVAALAHSTPLARATATQQGMPMPAAGSGLGGRVTSGDVLAQQPTVSPSAAPSAQTTQTPMKGIRRIIADRMRGSLQEMAQLTMHTAADARALRAYRARLKASDAALGVSQVSINDLLLFAVARTLRDFPNLNATLEADVITEYPFVNVGFAVDTPRGLMVPVIHHADQLSLKALSQRTRELADAAQSGKIAPDALQGGTFTVTNLGSFGIESFTPIINPPQVAILGVGNIHLKAVEVGDTVQHIPHLALSLTIDHQVVDGAPGARFLQALRAAITDIDLLLAL